MQLSPDAKERLGAVFDIVKTTFHWGFIPAVLYLGSANYFFDPFTSITYNECSKMFLEF